MNRIRPRLPAILAGLALAGTPAVRAQAPEDAVILRSGREVAGAVVKEDTAGIVVQTDPKNKAATQTFRWAEVDDVRYGDAPAAFTEAGQLLAEGKAEPALRGFDASLKDKARPWLAVEGNYGAARALEALGRADDAVARYLKVSADPAAARRAGDALMRAFRIRHAADDAEGAKKIVEAAGQAKALGAGAASRKKLMEARLQEASAPDAAKAAYDGLAADPDPDVKREAVLGRLRVYEAQKNWAELERAGRDLLGRGDPGLSAAAAVGVGEALRAKAAAGKDAALWREALNVYLRPVVTDLPPAGESSEAHARAQLGAAQCYEALSGLASGAEARSAYRDAAAFHYAQVAAELGKTAWGRKAAERLAALGGRRAN